MSFLLRLSLLLVFAMAAGILALLSMASGNESRVDSFYSWLVAANLVVVLAMAGLVSWVVVRAVRRHRARVFGSRLMVRLALAFAAMGIIPVVLVSLVSVQFLARSIDSWFSQGVERALDSGSALGRATLEAIQLETLSQARRLGVSLESVADENLNEAIETATLGREGLEVLVLNLKGRALAIRSASLFRLVPDMPSAEALERARVSRQFVIIEPRNDGPEWALQVRAIVLSIRPEPGLDQVRFVQWREPVPDALAQNIDLLNQGYSDYRQLALGKDGIRKIYGVTLSFALLLALFGALLTAVLLSAWLAGPLRSLERATRQVAGGDYPRIREDSTDHELNDLVRSFNDMTGQLEEAKRLALENQQKREASSRFLEQVLSHISAGVLVFDQDWQLTQFNPGAERLLRQPLTEALGAPLQALPILTDFAQDLIAAMARVSEDQQQHNVQAEDGATTSLLINISRLPNPVVDAPPLYVLVFDDISALMAAERIRAWSDIARRMAHEIKNPLTPIQLSAERMERRLLDKLLPADRELLQKSCTTIVDQVNGLKALVDEFRNYARLPAAQPDHVDLSVLIQEVMGLYASDPRIEAQIESSSCWVWADRGQLIQVIHNLVQNAQDAVMDQDSGRIAIVCQKVRRDSGHEVCRVRVEDNGPGLSPGIMHRVFEPYVTTKPKGTGLGLAIVKKIMEENQAAITVKNRTDAQGAILGVTVELEFAYQPLVSENSRHV